MILEQIHGVSPRAGARTRARARIMRTRIVTRARARAREWGRSNPDHSSGELSQLVLPIWAIPLFPWCNTAMLPRVNTDGKSMLQERPFSRCSPAEQGCSDGCSQDRSAERCSAAIVINRATTATALYYYSTLHTATTPLNQGAASGATSP